MRDIKFRAFYKDMIWTPESIQDGGWELASLWLNAGLIHYMQYTGLKDKNAYEGDIIRDNIGVGVIEYVDKYAAFRVNYINDRRKWFYDYLDSEMKCLEVIGNIYENPDLLTTP